jgi:hypothetical protein
MGKATCGTGKCLLKTVDSTAAPSGIRKEDRGLGSEILSALIPFQNIRGSRQ